MRHSTLAATFTLFLFAGPILAEPCAWMPDSRIDQAYGDRAPWSTMAGSAGRCKFVSDSRKPASTISLTQMVQESLAAAATYVSTVAAGMAKTYRVEPLKSIGQEGVAVREQEKDGRMLTLIGHRDNIVVMTQMSFLGGVDEAQQAEAVALTLEWLELETGGGLVLPSR
jgi:hypothetical protein